MIPKHSAFPTARITRYFFGGIVCGKSTAKAKESRSRPLQWNNVQLRSRILLWPKIEWTEGVQGRTLTSLEEPLCRFGLDIDPSFTTEVTTLGGEACAGHAYLPHH